MTVEFDCIDCGEHIVALGIETSPEDQRCALCHWLTEFIADEAERNEIRVAVYRG